MKKLQSAFETVRDRGIGSLASAVYHLAQANIQQKLLNKRYVLREVNDYKMYLDTKDKGICRSLILFGTREVDHKVILEHVLKPGMNIFDIGANIGYYVLMESKLIGDDGRILAIEPSPTNVQLLNDNLKLNGFSGATVIEGAVSDTAGSFDFYLAEQSNLNTFHKEGSAAPHLTGVTIQVQTFTVPELALQYGAPDLIRMDVEGHEVEIISGMLNDIEARRYQPMICFEPHISCYNDQHDFKPVLERLFNAGYVTRYLSSNAENGTKRITALGYKPIDVIESDGEQKALFEWISPADTANILTKVGGARTVLLAPKSNDNEAS